MYSKDLCIERILQKSKDITKFKIGARDIDHRGETTFKTCDSERDYGKC